MKVCFPVEQDKGIESAVYGHFGTAPTFVVIDTDQKNVGTVSNANMIHEHGACNPIMALGGNQVDAVVVGGIGAGALMGLNAKGIKVYRALEQTVKGNLELLEDNALPELTINHTCGGHAGGCAHH
ncbi:MAG TPA: NifB/NifX family molybdenum-iron cluster-binding protein [Syntrophorhabdaceae bacterium]|nr:NifB/NifX family molybdenum-iron cluster-binding protein [Syntrophorhabdaceae bacterium]